MLRFPPGAPAGIRFGDWYFTEPVPLARWRPPKNAGLYVILLPDFTWIPRPLQPVYFGEFSPSHVPITHDEYISWFRVAAGRDLYIAAHEIPPMRATELAAIKSELIRLYRPVTNSAAHNTTSEALAQRLEAVERRSHEQEALLRVVFAAMGKLLEPPPEPRKRNFGFHHAGTQTRKTSGPTASGK